MLGNAGRSPSRSHDAGPEVAHVQCDAIAIEHRVREKGRPDFNNATARELAAYPDILRHVNMQDLATGRHTDS